MGRRRLETDDGLTRAEAERDDCPRVGKVDKMRETFRPDDATWVGRSRRARGAIRGILPSSVSSSAYPHQNAILTYLRYRLARYVHGSEAHRRWIVE